MTPSDGKAAGETVEVGVTIGGACYPDYNGDGTLDLFDFLAFVNAFNAGDLAADCDGNGSSTSSISSAS